MRTITFQTVLILVLTSFFTSNGQNLKKDFWGVPLTCMADSTSITLDTLINLKRATPTGEGPYPKNPQYRHRTCENAPDYIEFVQFWPTQMTLHFKKKTYFFLHSPRPTDSEIKYGEKGFSVTYSYDSGTISLDKKKKLLTLTSNKYNWTRTYKITYSKQDDIITLQSKNGY